MLVWKDEKLLLLERKKFPFGFAIPAGHVEDNEKYEDGAIRELREEVGLNAIKLDLILEKRKENKCRREDGIWHLWKIYKVGFTGDITGSIDETKKVIWCDKEEIKKLAEKTERYLRKEILETDWSLETLPEAERINTLSFFALLLKVEKRINPKMNVRHSDT
jgi:ADP-ribose pyrophosphatase YjhB (NUDIX family)